MRRSRYYLIGFLPLMILATPFVWDWVAGILKREAQFRESERLLGEAVAELDLADPGWRWADRVARKSDLPDEENVFVRIGRVKSLLNRQFQMHPSGSGYLLQDADVEPNRLHTADDTAELGQHQAQFAPAVASASGLETLSRGYAPTPADKNPYALLTPHIHEMREAVALLRYEVEWRALNDRPREAIPLLRSMLVVANSPGEDGCLIGNLVRNAGLSMTARQVERLLGLTRPGEDLRTLLGPLRQAGRGDAFGRALRGERAFADGSFVHFENHPEALKELLSGVRQVAGKNENLLRKYEPLLRADHASAVRQWTAILGTRELLPHERRAAIREIERGWPQLDLTFDRLIGMETMFRNPDPNGETKTEQLFVAEQRSVAQIECARVLVACELFRLGEKGWPKTLGEIPKDLLPETPADPFDGRPLRYRVLEDGIAVWSIGEHFVEEPAELQGGEKPRPSMLFRAWNPEQRRLPGPPPLPELLHDPIELPDEGPKEKE